MLPTAGMRGCVHPGKMAVTQLSKEAGSPTGVSTLPRAFRPAVVLTVGSGISSTRNSGQETAGGSASNGVLTGNRVLQVTLRTGGQELPGNLPALSGQAIPVIKLESQEPSKVLGPEVPGVCIN